MRTLNGISGKGNNENQETSGELEIRKSAEKNPWKIGTMELMSIWKRRNTWNIDGLEVKNLETTGSNEPWELMETMEEINQRNDENHGNQIRNN